MNRVTAIHFFDTIFGPLWRFLKNSDQKQPKNVNNDKKYQRSCLQMLPLKDNFIPVGISEKGWVIACSPRWYTDLVFLIQSNN